MFAKHITSIGALVIAGAALAQATMGVTTPAPKRVGKTEKVQGLVTVSIHTSVSSVTENGLMFEGSRYVTGSTGSARLHFDDECIVDLQPSQTYLVDTSSPCERRFAFWLVAPTGALLAGGATLGPIAGGLSFVAGVALIDSTLQGPTVNGGGTGNNNGNNGNNDGSGGVIPNPPISTQ